MLAAKPQSRTFWTTLPHLRPFAGEAAFQGKSERSDDDQNENGFSASVGNQTYSPEEELLSGWLSHQKTQEEKGAPRTALARPNTHLKGQRHPFKPSQRITSSTSPKLDGNYYRPRLGASSGSPGASDKFQGSEDWLTQFDGLSPQTRSTASKPRAEDQVAGPFTRQSLNRPREPREGVARSYKSKSANLNAGNERRRPTRRRFARNGDEDENRFELDDDEFVAKKKSRKEKAKQKRIDKRFSGPPTPIVLPEFISVVNLATVLRVKNAEFLEKMEDMGFQHVTGDHILDSETAGLVAAEFNFELVAEKEEKNITSQIQAQDRSQIPSRPPVVTIMGHVDHGKTTMLDFLRKSSVAASEHGGITQHIGAFSVRMPGGRLVTFLDTPGHEAFLSMRQRGANVTDIVVLVVAADDSVKPQTIEAIKHAQRAKVPVIVAINKIDKPEANIERVKQDLPRYGVEIEDIGGDTQVVCVSGKTGQGMEELEENIVALADVMDARAEIDGQVEGWVLEASTTKEQGRKATILVRRGTLRAGDIIVAGTSWARVRGLKNEAGADVASAGPGTPVEVDGWREQPTAGDEVLQAPTEQKARSVVEYRQNTSDQKSLAEDVTAVNASRRQESERRALLKSAQEAAKTNREDPSRIEINSLLPSNSATSVQDVYFIIKADVSGSVEAVNEVVSGLGNNEVRVHVLRTGIGSVSEFDVDHATAAKGHIINFNTPCDNSVLRLAESRGVRILDQTIIYRLVDDVKSILEEKLTPLVKQRVTGEAEIAQVFSINIKGRINIPIAGCRVRNGEITRAKRIRVLRDNEVIYTGTCASDIHSANDSEMLD